MKTNSIIKLMVMLIAILFANNAYCQTKYIEVGGTLMLDVPSAKIGYVDKAIWACSNPAISFVSKSNVYAEIKALKSFDGCATIELVYVESYVDNKGFTRAITYTKNFYVYCKGGTSGGGISKTATSISVEPEMKVALGERLKIYYHLYPEGSTADVYSSGGVGAFHQDDGYYEFLARKVGTNDVSLYFYNEKDEKVSADCRVTVYDPTWTEPESISIPNDLLLTVGETKKILPIVTPKSATAIYYWYSDNYSVASFSDGGVVAKKAGIANIKLETSNGLMAKCTVVVLDDKQIPGLNKALNRNFSMLQSAEDEVVK